MAQVGTLTRQFAAGASIPSTRYTFRTTYNGDFNGVYQTTGPNVMVAQILRWPQGAPGWIPVRGDETGLEEVAVGIYTLAQDNTILGFTTAVPLATGPESLDDETSVAFRPKYLVNEGWQRLYFVGQVKKRNPDGQLEPVCCSRDLYSWQYSAAPTLQALRVLQGGGMVPTGGQAMTSDSGLAFRVPNNSSDSLYARVTVAPNVPGDEVLVLSSSLVRDADGDLVLPGASTVLRSLPLVAGTQGGRVRFELYAKDYVSSPAVKVLQDTEDVDVRPPQSDLFLAGLPLRARWVLPVWDFVSAQKPVPGQPPPDDAQESIAYGAPLGMKVFVNGRLVVRRGETEVASAQVLANATGITQVSSLGGALMALGQGGFAVVELLPGAVGLETVRVTLVPENPNQASVNQEVPLTTTVGTVSRVPVGHTFVKGVSVVDGHLVKQSVDVEAPSRGLGLSWLRAYSSGDSEEGALGRGWRHAYEGGRAAAERRIPLRGHQWRGRWAGVHLHRGWHGVRAAAGLSRHAEGGRRGGRPGVRLPGEGWGGVPPRAAR